MNLDEAVKLALEKNSILFAGAGHSVSALNLKDEAMKPARALSEYLFSIAGQENNETLSDAVEEYVEQFGEFSLIKLLKEQYTAKQIHADHETLGSVRWKRIYTTNYDDVLETAYKQNGKTLTPVTLSDKLHNFQDKSAVCIHLNGFIDQLNIETLNHEFKLSDVSYLTNDFSQTEWVNLFRNDLTVSDAIFFVGFSLIYDLDLKRIIYQNNLELHKKCFFILREDEPATTVKRVSKFGQPCLIGISKFAELIRSVQASYIPREKTETKLFSFSKLTSFDAPPTIKDSDFRDFLTEGKIDYKILQYSTFVPDSYDYFVERGKVQTVLDGIENGSENILVLSDLGNGKTTFIEGLSFRLKEKGFEVFKFEKYYDTVSKEIELICSYGPKTVLVLENYSHHYDILEQLKLHRTKDLILILSERTLIHDVSFPKLESRIGDNYLSVDVNLLSDKDIKKFINLIDKYGYWEDLSSYGIERKETFLKETCRRNLRLFLLKLINSPNILKKFEDITNEIKKTRNHFEALILILASKVFSFHLDLDELVYVYDEVLNNPIFIKDANIREFVDFSNRRITVNSSILAESILQNLEEPEIVVASIVKVCRRLDPRRRDPNVKNILRQIISFSNLQRVLGKEDRGKIYFVLNFFEEVKNLDFCNKSDHFWLQYAIARLAERNYDLADTYFKTAYSFAEKKRDYDTYQLDTHYARYILENEIYNGTLETCMSQFLKAHKTLANPSEKDRSRHYLYKVAQNYYPFYERYFKKLAAQDKVIFIRSCKEMLNRVTNYLDNTAAYRVKRDVNKAQELLTNIVDAESRILETSTGN